MALSTMQALRHGHEVGHLSEEGLTRIPRSSHLVKRLKNHRVIITCDLDFADLPALDRRLGGSLIWTARHIKKLVDTLNKMGRRDWFAEEEGVTYGEAVDLAGGIGMAGHEDDLDRGPFEQ
jgi:hypothetical protein